MLKEVSIGNSIEIKGKTFRLHDTLLSAPYPQMLSIESTNFCNLCCSHCGHSQLPGFNKGHLEIGIFEKIEDLLGSGIKGLSLSNFGEPFISKEWNTLLGRALLVEGLNISFITNGLLLDRHLEEVIDPRISIAISIDGVTEETYGYFRGCGNLSRLLRNMELLRDIKEKKGGNFPRLTLLFTVSRVNVHELEKIVDLASTYGAETVIVQLQLFFNRKMFEAESLFFKKEEYDRHIAAASRRAMKTGINLIHPDSFDGDTVVNRESIDNSWLGWDDEGRIKCFSHNTVCYIKYNGIIEACCSPNHNIMGNLETDSFDDIWYGPNYRELRLAFARGEWPERCRYCNLIQAVDVHDTRAHLVEVHGTSPFTVPYPQKYKISDVEKIYKELLSILPKDTEEALRLISRVSGLDENLYEVGNLAACLRGMNGETDTMLKGLERCREIAPGDPCILNNYNNLKDLIAP